MPVLRLSMLIGGLLVLVITACVDQLDLGLRGTVDVIVVDGTITNLPEPQIIRLNLSKADPVTGRFGTRPLTKATVQVMVDSTQMVPAHETVDGSYQLPSDFRGEVGHSYALRIVVPDGTEYRSTAQVMPAVPALGGVKALFNRNSLPADQYEGFRAGHDIYIDMQDPTDEHNYYRWDWVLYEKQEWCRSCVQGVYAVNKILPRQYMYMRYYVSGTEPYEDCFVPVSYGDYGEPPIDKSYYIYDYRCRTDCWEILRNYTLHLFDDLYSNGGIIRQRLVGHIPYYTYLPALVVVRQASLTPDAYRYYKLFQDQTEKTGGLADTPPTALLGNVSRVGEGRSSVVGYFTASAVSQANHWLDRRDAEGVPMGALDPAGPPETPGDFLFYALNKRRPNPEPYPPYTGERQSPKIQIWGGPPRVPTAICVPSDSRTPIKPQGWQD